MNSIFISGCWRESKCVSAVKVLLWLCSLRKVACRRRDISQTLRAGKARDGCGVRESEEYSGREKNLS